MRGKMKGEYKTKARKCIVDFLKEHADRRFTVREIYDQISTEAGGIDKTTVYRNLERLSDQGEIIKIKEPNSDSWFFQYSEDHKHCNSHMHAQCSECGKVFHLEEDFVEEFEEKVRKEYGLDVNLGKTVIVGKCDDCKKKD